MAIMRTALVRREDGNLHICRYDDYNSQKEFAEDLRGNGYAVLKIWNGYISDAEVDEWEFLNRKQEISPPDDGWVALSRNRPLRGRSWEALSKVIKFFPKNFQKTFDKIE